jgi:hypothetical protein
MIASLADQTPLEIEGQLPAKNNRQTLAAAPRPRQPLTFLILIRKQRKNSKAIDIMHRGRLTPRSE